MCVLIKRCICREIFDMFEFCRPPSQPAVLTQTHAPLQNASTLVDPAVRRFVRSYLPPSMAMAWNSPGHEIIALIAYEHLDDATRAKAIELLAPIRDFTIISKASCRKRFRAATCAIKTAGYLPTRPRGPIWCVPSKGAVNRQDVSEYSRPWWHFINEPVFLNDDERRQLEREIKVNRRREPPQSDDDEFMNIVQAIKNSARIVRDTSAPKEKRSVHLCWILHLVGDSHQPLHSVALYTTHRFRRGDHGGNYLDYQHSWDLHGFWDEQISTDESYETHQVLAADLDRNRKLAEEGKKAAATLESINGSTRAWNWPSDTLTRRKCWRKSPLAKDIRISGRSTCRRTYKIEAETVAERRAVEAGHRLAGAVRNRCCNNRAARRDFAVRIGSTDSSRSFKSNLRE